MRLPGVVLAALGVAMILSACGGGGSSTGEAASHNEEVVEHAEGKDASKEAIEAELDRKFSFAKGMQAPMSMEIGSEKFCYIEDIYIGSEVQPHAKEPTVLISPDESEALSVGWYEGTPKAECLSYVKEALGW